jgi:hypothetical protein
MSFNIVWSGRHKECNGRIWGYLVNNDEKTERGYCTYYSFWGRKNGVIHFQRIKEYTMRNEFKRTVKRKKEKYSQDDNLHTIIAREFGQLEIIRKLKQGV